MAPSVTAPHAHVLNIGLNTHNTSERKITAVRIIWPVARLSNMANNLRENECQCIELLIKTLIGLLNIFESLCIKSGFSHPDYPLWIRGSTEVKGLRSQ